MECLFPLFSPTNTAFAGDFRNGFFCARCTQPQGDVFPAPGYVLYCSARCLLRRSRYGTALVNRFGNVDFYTVNSLSSYSYVSNTNTAASDDFHYTGTRKYILRWICGFTVRLIYSFPFHRAWLIVGFHKSKILGRMLRAKKLILCCYDVDSLEWLLSCCCWVNQALKTKTKQKYPSLWSLILLVWLLTLIFLWYNLYGTWTYNYFPLEE